MPSIHDVVKSLSDLEKKLGTSPSVADIANHLGVSPSTTHRLLKGAVTEGLICQRDGQFMTMALAKKFDELKG